MTHPTVVVIVRTLGQRPAFLVEAVASVLAQSYPGVRVVVAVDGAASPNFDARGLLSGPFMREIVGSDRRIFFAQESWTKGRSATANLGISVALHEDVGADMIGFCDDDDVLLPWWASDLASALEANSKAVAAYCDAQVNHCDWQNRPLRPGHLYSGPFTLEDLRQANRRPNNALLFRRSVPGQGFPFRDQPLPRFDDGDVLCEDYGFLLRVARLGPLVHVPIVGAEYRIRGQGVTGNTAPEAMAEWARRVRERWAA